MPNTITTDKLKAAFEEMCGSPTRLTPRQIHDLWSSTRTNNNTGRNMDKETLSQRVWITRQLMWALEKAMKERGMEFAQ